jgi:acetyl esterase
MTATIDPELAAVLEADLATYGPRAKLRRDNVAEQRADTLRRRLPRAAGGPKMAQSRDLMLELPGREIRARLHVPASATTPGPVLVFFHGGGWVLCTIDTHDHAMRELARVSGCRVLGVDYRKAPEHPFPGPYDDCVEACLWAFDRAESLGIDPGRFALGGDSAGGNLALAAGLGLAAKGHVASTHLLVYGAFDSDLQSSSYCEFADGRFGLSQDDMALFYELYVPHSVSRQDPRAFPLHGDLDQVRHAFILAAGLDVLRDDSRRLAERLAQRGISHEFCEIANAVHGCMNYFEVASIPRRFLGAAGRHLRSTFTD